MNDALASFSFGGGHQPVTTEQLMIGNSSASPTSPIMAREPLDAHVEAMELSAPATVPKDTIIHAINAFAVSERRTNFFFLARYNHGYMNGEDLSVHSAPLEEVTRACKRWGLNPAELSSFKWYTVHQTISKLSHTVPVRCHSPSVDIVHLEVLDVEGTKSWMDIRIWMRKTLEWHDGYDRKFPELQYEEQAIWWRNNGKAFCLMQLPPEVRDIIYTHALGPIILPQARTRVVFPDHAVGFPTISNHISLGLGHTHGKKGRLGAKQDPDIDRPNLALLLVSRQVRDEALDAAWRCTTKRFRATIASASLLCFRKPPDQDKLILQMKELGPPSVLNYVQLEFSAACYFELIGIQPQQGRPMARLQPPPGRLSIHMLKKIPTIRTLDFRFMSPKHPSAVCPWNAPSPFDYYSPQKPHSCQKVWVDWFFTLALDQLGHCSFKITMSGCVKDSTRAKWEPIFEAESKGLKHDMTLQARAIRLGKRDSEPIPCNCSKPCPAPAIDPFDRFDAGERRTIPGLQREIDEQYFSYRD